MGLFDRQSPRASPVLTLPSQPLPDASSATSSFGRQHTPVASENVTSIRTLPYNSASFQRPAAGRKRSRDEASANLGPDLVSDLPTSATETGWIYGEGMVLIKPDTPYIADAGSQSGTWLEEASQAAAAKKALRQLEAQSVDFRNIKSHRVDQSVSTLSSSGTRQLGASLTHQTPVIDNFTLHLGVGWRELSHDVDIQAAARGWARYIDNHFPLTNTVIRLESRGLQSYLVEANEGFFLFADDLRRGRLVSRNVDAALRNLQRNPPIFDGQDELMATESPRLGTNQQEKSLMNAGMEMD